MCSSLPTRVLTLLEGIGILLLIYSRKTKISLTAEISQLLCSVKKNKCVVCSQVNYFNETHAVWEPLLERVDGGRRRWNLEFEVKLLAAKLALNEFCVAVIIITQCHTPVNVPQQSNSLKSKLIQNVLFVNSFMSKTFLCSSYKTSKLLISNSPPRCKS